MTSTISYHIRCTDDQPAMVYYFRQTELFIPSNLTLHVRWGYVFPSSELTDLDNKTWKSLNILKRHDQHYGVANGNRKRYSKTNERQRYSTTVPGIATFRWYVLLEFLSYLVRTFISWLKVCLFSRSKDSNRFNLKSYHIRYRASIIHRNKASILFYWIRHTCSLSVEALYLFATRILLWFEIPSSWSENNFHDSLWCKLLTSIWHH